MRPTALPERADPTTPRAVAEPATRLPMRALLAYGGVGVPLAMAALPLYVQLPRHYAEHLRVDLAALGAVLLALRVADALLDPVIGAWSDRGWPRRRLVGVALPVLATGMVALFVPPVDGEVARLAWLAASLALVYIAFSVATINHGAWGAELADDPRERTRVTAVREALALGAVVVASVAPSMLADEPRSGAERFALVYAVAVIAALALMTRAPGGGPSRWTPARHGSRGAWSALADPAFRALLSAFVVNGIAAAIPATLALFFVADVLQAPEREGVFLALYFVAGAAGMPAWFALAARIGKVAAWRAGQGLSIVAFLGAATLGPGDALAFALICIASGAALGADLALPPSMLADVLGRRGAIATAGPAFGLWTLATKANLALAAGIALPLLGALGYAPGTQDPAALATLSTVYAIVPCALKAIAFAMLGRLPSRLPESR